MPMPPCPTYRKTVDLGIESDNRQPVRRKCPQSRPGRDRPRAWDDRRCMKSLERHRHVDIVGIRIAGIGGGLFGEAHHDRAGIWLEIVASVDRRDERMCSEASRAISSGRRSSQRFAASAAARDGRRRRAPQPRRPRRRLRRRSCRRRFDFPRRRRAICRPAVRRGAQAHRSGSPIRAGEALCKTLKHRIGVEIESVRLDETGCGNARLQQRTELRQFFGLPANHGADCSASANSSRRRGASAAPP